MTKILVYGTLRQGFGNSALWRGTELSVSPCLIHDVRLVMGPFRYPYALPSKGALAVGDLITLDPRFADEVMDNLDYLEGVSHQNYERVEGTYATLDEPQTKNTGWLYIAHPRTIAQYNLDFNTSILNNDWANVARRTWAQA